MIVMGYLIPERCQAIKCDPITENAVRVYVQNKLWCKGFGPFQLIDTVRKTSGRKGGEVIRILHDDLIKGRQLGFLKDCLRGFRFIFRSFGGNQEDTALSVFSSYQLYTEIYVTLLNYLSVVAIIWSLFYLLYYEFNLLRFLIVISIVYLGLINVLGAFNDFHRHMAPGEPLAVLLITLMFVEWIKLRRTDVFKPVIK